MVKRRLRLFTSIIVVACVSSCGIDTLSYLSGEPVSVSSDETALSFTGPTTGDSDYSGVYVFYKIYAYEGSATTDYNYVITKQSDDDAVPGAIITSYLTTSSGLGYKELMLNGKAYMPTLKGSSIDSGKIISIDFSGFQSGIEPVLSVEGGTEYVINRSVTDSGGYLSFLENEPVSGNADYKSYSDDDDENTYFVQFFAASYGYDSSLNDVYSDAVFLGLITLNY